MEISTLLREISKEQTRQGRSIDRIDTSLHGNGQVGLKTQCHMNTKSIGKLWFVLGIILTGLIGCAWKAFGLG